MATFDHQLRGAGSVARVRLYRFKGFEDFTLSLRGSAYIVGPNNAGKSTIINALRLVAVCLKEAIRLRPSERRYDARLDREFFARPIPGKHAFVDENVHFEFRDEVSCLEVFFTTKARLAICWPPDETPFYYLEHIAGAQPPSVAVVKRFYPVLGIIQPPAPVEHQEQRLSESHIRDNLGSRLSSRHFRNQLLAYREESRESYERYQEFVLENTPELLSIEVSYALPSTAVDVFYVERGSKVAKEIFWAGDGLQIWLQLLFHIFRQSDVNVLILDEPDIYLHPDMQRRMVSIIDGMSGQQVVLASHAPEVLSEAQKGSVVIVDRTKKRGVRVDNEEALETLNLALGSGFNLRLARALRSRVALFVEGGDMKILRQLARKVGASNFAAERGLALVALNGGGNRSLAASFGLLNRTLLDSAVAVCLVLDRDYSSDASVDQLQKDFEDEGVELHIWERHELESYLLSLPVIAAVSGAQLSDIEKQVDAVLADLKHHISSRRLADEVSGRKSSKEHNVDIFEKFQPAFEAQWGKGREERLHMAPAKEVISGLNRRLTDLKLGKAVSARALANRVSAARIPEEMRDFLLGIESRLQGS